MKENLLVLGVDYELSKQVAIELADVFSLRYFDQKELLLFDHVPLSFGEIIEKNNIEYVFKKMRSIIKMELDFEGAVFASDSCVVTNCEDLFDKIKHSNLIIALNGRLKEEFNQLQNKQYDSNQEKEFYCISKSEIIERKQKFTNLADIVVDVTNLTPQQICNEVVDKIKQFYNLK